MSEKVDPPVRAGGSLPGPEGVDHQHSSFKKGPVSPEGFAWLPSRLTLWWLNTLFRTGYRQRIEEDDLYEMLDHNKSSALTHALMEKWEAEKKKASLKTGKEPSLLRAVFKTFWRRYYTSAIGVELGGNKRMGVLCLLWMAPHSPQATGSHDLLPQ